MVEISHHVPHLPMEDFRSVSDQIKKALQQLFCEIDSLLLLFRNSTSALIGHRADDR